METLADLLAAIPKGQGALRWLLQLCTAHRIRVRWGKDRVLLSVVPAAALRAVATSSLALECNGVVLCKSTMQCLVVPPKAMLDAATCDRTWLASQLAEKRYDLSFVDDGTTCTLYRWDGSWCLSTRNTYDASTLRWMGEQTYAEIVCGLLGATGLALHLVDGRLDIPWLDPGYCYTIGFRHHDFHPFRNDPARVWNVGKAHLATGVVSRGVALPGLPGPRSNRMLRRVLCWGDVERMCRWSLAKAGLHAAQGVCGENHFRYGVVFVSTAQARSNTLPNLLYTSDLLEFVRQWMYREPPPFGGHSVRLYRKLSRTFQETRAWSRNTFLALFPQYKKQFEAMERFGHI